MRSNKGKQPLYSTSPDASSSVKSRSMTSNRPLSQAMSSSPSQASLPPSVQSDVADAHASVHASVHASAHASVHASSPQKNMYICPICESISYGLTALNNHIDSFHPTDTNRRNSPDADPDDPAEAIFSWFRRTQTKVAAPFANTSWQKIGLDRIAAGLKGSAQAPLDLINGVEAFELNSNTIITDASGHKYASGADTSLLSGQFYLMSSPSATLDGGYSSTAVGSSSASISSADTVLVSRAHWQRSAVDDGCSYPHCSRRLGLISGSVNCRKCGKLYCDSHSRFQMKLAVDTSHDASAGYWCRVCESCYISRKGHFDTNGVSRNRTQGFLKLRAVRIDRALLEANKIEKRLEKISRSFSGGSPQLSHQRSWSNLSTLGRHSIDQAVVSWVPDDSSHDCSICASLFGILNRRHHCRLCGQLVCGTCSEMLDIRALSANTGSIPEKTGQIRTCSNCKELINMRENQRQSGAIHKVVPLYQQVVRLRSLVQQTLPKFNGLLVELRTRSKVSLQDQDYQIALKHRKQLLDYFTELERTAKQIKTLATPHAATQRLYSSIHQAAIQFLQANMLTLQLMPTTHEYRVDQHAMEENRVARKRFATHADEDEYALLGGTLTVLEEQVSQLESMLLDATSRRRLEDAVTLNESLGEMRQEAERVRHHMKELCL
ncbi:hypothetical protein BASA50_007420 [Batrachochytrium salamandrivorans]|uniref:FYVE-type domain-containing protein n=1 Tax=Batrachochytrium salamandrivorans TaxID=1357716 RepID=A0ABQ8F6P5_9FUNG|nr:hypothetical protein BASA60_000195 [Batrachochytrium salamandrivorans]KAH6593213.1 hypothetical protein BASA50_007420 [Batrachochytrium salamandrivorans]